MLGFLRDCVNLAARVVYDRAGWFNLPSTNVPEINDIALAVMRVQQSWQHSGIVYVDADGATWLLHLAGHHRLVRQRFAAPTSDDYLTVRNAAIDPIRAPSVVAFCDLIWEERAHNRIPYQFIYHGNLFDKSGRWGGASNYGLTCSTFVLALHASIGIQLVELETWRPRLDDHDEQMMIVDEALQFWAPPERVDMLRKEVGQRCARLRPQEIAASYAAVWMPLSFAVARRLGSRILSALLKHERSQTTN